VKKIHDYVHHYRGYWSEGGKCRIRIYEDEAESPVVICSQLLDNVNTSINEHGRVPSGGGDRRALPTHALGMGRAIPRASKARGILPGPVSISGA
jgi:hypothetical protein